MPEKKFHLSDEDFAAYRAHEVTAEEIAEHHGVSHETVYTAIRERGGTNRSVEKSPSDWPKWRRIAEAVADGWDNDAIRAEFGKNAHVDAALCRRVLREDLGVEFCRELAETAAVCENYREFEELALEHHPELRTPHLRFALHYGGWRGDFRRIETAVHLTAAQVRRYKAGEMSTAQLAEEIGASTTSVRNALHRWGVKLFSREESSRLRAMRNRALP